MKPQDNEPCPNCRHWSDDYGCEYGRYDRASMIIFGYCGVYKREHPDENDNNR